MGGYYETSSLEITSVMDAQPVAPFESYVNLCVKCTTSAECKSIRVAVSTVIGLAMSRSQ